MKKIISSFCLALVLIFCISGCEVTKYAMLSDMEEYQDLNRNPEFIKVRIIDRVYGDFIVSEKSEIDKVIEILFDETLFERAQKCMVYDGLGGVIKICYKGGREVELSLFSIQSGGRTWLY